MDLQKDVTSLVEEICNPHMLDLSDPTRSLVDIGLDSLDFASLLMALEDKYDFEISDEEMQTVRTLNNLFELTEKKLSNET